MTRGTDRTYTKQKQNALLHFILRCISQVKKTIKCRIFNYYEMGTDYTRKKS